MEYLTPYLPTAGAFLEEQVVLGKGHWNRIFPRHYFNARHRHATDEHTDTPGQWNEFHLSMVMM